MKKYLNILYAIVIAAGFALRYLKKVPAVGIVETALDLAGKATGADKYTDAILDLPAYQGVANEMLKAYNDSVAAVAEGKGTLDNVRLNFTGLKQALTSYFEKNETYYKGMIDGAKSDAKRLAYSKYMLDRVKEMELGKSFEFLGFDEFINTYSI